MRKIVITGATGDLGSVVVPRLARDYDCLTPRRNDPLEQIDGSVYGLVHLVGGFAPGDDFDAMLDVNLKPAIRAIAALAPKLEEGGRIVAISAGATRSLPAGLGAYVASKAALEAYLGTLSKQLAPRRITVNAILPATLDTPANASMKTVPRADVAETIAFLLSDAAAHITGERIAMA